MFIKNTYFKIPFKFLLSLLISSHNPFKSSRSDAFQLWSITYQSSIKAFLAVLRSTKLNSGTKPQCNSPSKSSHENVTENDLRESNSYHGLRCQMLKVNGSNMEGSFQFNVNGNKQQWILWKILLLTLFPQWRYQSISLIWECHFNLLLHQNNITNNKKLLQVL